MRKFTNAKPVQPRRLPYNPPVPPPPPVPEPPTPVAEPETYVPRLLYPIEESLHLLGISRSTFYALVAAGELHPVKIGARTLVAHTELERFVTHLTEVEAGAA